MLFEYDPSDGGQVPVRLLDDFQGILQADGYSGYGKMCLENNLTWIKCWDHSPRKFVEACKSAMSETLGTINNCMTRNLVRPYRIWA